MYYPKVCVCTYVHIQSQSQNYILPQNYGKNINSFILPYIPRSIFFAKLEVEANIFAKHCLHSAYQGCQMAYFQTKNPNLGKFWRDMQWKMLVYFTSIWQFLWPFGKYYGYISDIFFRFCMLNRYRG
jgi:hypothetical protein